MALAFVVIAAVFAYGAGGFALWFGAGWILSLLILSGVGTSVMLVFAFAAQSFGETRPVAAHPNTSDPITH